MSTADCTLHDWLGNTIEQGAFIVYPSRQGSSLWMVYAEVLEVKTVHDEWSKVDSWILRAQPLKHTFYFGQSTDKPVTIKAIDRVTVVPREVTCR